MSPPTLSHSLSFTWALSLSHTHSLSNIPSFSNILTDTLRFYQYGRRG